jgi:DNA-binding protein HU-beta
MEVVSIMRPAFRRGTSSNGLSNNYWEALPDCELGKERFVIKLDIINNVAEKTGVPKMKAEVAVEALFEAMKEAMKRGERIELRGFGVFVVKPRKRGIGRNPRTGTQVAIPEGKTIRFKPGKELQS